MQLNINCVLNSWPRGHWLTASRGKVGGGGVAWGGGLQGGGRGVAVNMQSDNNMRK